MRRLNFFNIFLNKYVYYHTIYWVVNVLFFSVIFWSRNNYKDFAGAFHENFAYLPGGIIFSYVIVNYLIPKYYFKNKIFPFISLLLVVLLLYPILSSVIKAYYIDPVIYKVHTPYRIERVLSTILILIFCFIPLAGVKILKQFRISAVQNEKVKNDKVTAELKLREAELKLLKGQVHPHFLFNTLNNLYSLSIQKSEKTPEVIIKISDMLNYIIYECNAEKVSLEKELEFLQSYIDLEKLRYDESLKITTSITGDFKGKFIAPMILHTFIENSFKHGASKDIGRPWIDIYLTVNANWLNFTAINSKIIEDGESKSGIGIENAKKRLNLIYPNQHSIEIVNNKNIFNVSLEIQL